MVNNSDDYRSYAVTVPVTLFVEACNPDRAVDVATEAIFHSSNFNVLKNAEVDWHNAKVQQGHEFNVSHSN